MSVQLLRGTRVWASTVTSGFTTANTQEILVQDDISFSQDANVTDITVNEAGPRPTRGSKRFNDSLNPADWSFSTYILPYVDPNDNLVKLPDVFLWQGLCSGSPLDLDGDHGVHTNQTNLMVDFKDNAYHELLMLQFYILLDNIWYRIKDCQINQAEINVDIEDIGLTTWSGNGTQIEQLDAAPFDVATLGMSDEFYARLQGSYLKNKLTILKLKDMETSKAYDVPITGGTITINNNVTYLTPNTLSRVDIPIGSFTGSFEVTGSLSAYMNDKAMGSAELYQDLLTTLKSINKFELSIVLGGEYDVERPAAILTAKQAHMNIPSIETDDVLGTTVEFKAIPTELDAGDEAFLGFSPKYTKTTINNFIVNGDGAVPATVAVTGVTISPKTATLAPGATRQLTPTVAPSNASNKAVTYASSATSVASVNSSGLVTVSPSATNGQTATITVTTADGAKKDTCVVTVQV